MSRQISFFFLLAILFTLFPKAAYATYNNISGTYTGTLSGTDVSGSPPGCDDDGPFSGTLTLTLIGDDQGNITGGQGSFTNNSFDGTDFIFDISGLNDNTNFTFNFTTADSIGGAGDPGTVTGTFTANSITITNGSVSNIECSSVNLNGTLTKATNSTVLASEFTPSSSLTEAILFSTQMQTTISGISNRIGGALSSIRSIFFTPTFGENQFNMNGMTGLNAGDDGSMPYGIWGNYSYTNFENDFSATAFDGSSHNFLGGIDFQVFDRTVLGIAFGYDKSDIDTGFNRGNQDTDTITIAPYFGAILTDVLSVDFNIGYSRVEYDQYRSVGTTRINSSPDADRWFGAFNLNAVKFIDSWIIGGRVGMLFARSEIEDYVESDGTNVDENRTRVGTFSIATDIAYSFNEWEPFLNLAYQYDYALKEVVTAAGSAQPANDEDNILLSTGIRYFEQSGLSGNLEYSKRLLREDYDEDRISITVRIDY